MDIGNNLEENRLEVRPGAYAPNAVRCTVRHASNNGTTRLIFANYEGGCFSLPEHASRRINEIIHGKRGITADTAMRLALFFGTSAQLWLGLQVEYELDCIKRADGGTLRKIIKKFTPSAKVAAML